MKWPKPKDWSTAILAVATFFGTWMTLFFASESNPVATTLALGATLIAGIWWDYLGGRPTDLGANDHWRHTFLTLLVATVAIILAGIVTTGGNDEPDTVGSCHAWPECAFQTGYCHDKCRPPADMTLGSFDPDSGRDELDLPNGLTVYIINTHGVIAPSDDTFEALSRNVDAAVANRVFRDDANNYWTLIWMPSSVSDAEVSSALKQYLAELSPNTNPVTPTAASCNPDNDGQVGSCVGCPFCELQSGYCKDNCCSGGGIGPHICGMDGCMGAEPGTLDYEQVAQAADKFGADEVQALLDKHDIHTLVADDGTHISTGELGKKTGCDCPFCAKNLGWPACYVCHSCED